MKVFFIGLTMLLTMCLDAQEFDVDTLLFNGAVDTRINLVYMGDGYTVDELGDFVKDAMAMNDYVFSIEPFKSYRNYFNSFAIKVPSNESGADHPGTATDVTEPIIPVKNVDSYFNSTFDYFDIHRLLVPASTSLILNTLAANVPNYDQPILIVNSTEYGGSGGFVATVSIGNSAAEVAVHEMGHSFANLSDEYYAGDVYAGETANMSQITDPENLTWKNWHGENGIGNYQHCCSETARKWYRPHQDCKMRYLGVPFCSVCTETIIERIHSFVSPLVSYTPTVDDTVSILDDLRFEIELINPEPNTNQVQWVVNNQEYVRNTEILQLTFDQLIPEKNIVSVSITDTTELIRIDNHNDIHVDIITWEFDNITTATTDLSINGREYQLFISPNPSDDFILVELRGRKIQKAELIVTDLSGRVVITESVVGDEQSMIDVSGLPSSMYLISLRMAGQIVHSEKLFIN